MACRRRARAAETRNRPDMRVDELTLFVVGQDIAQLADGQLSEGFMVEILFFLSLIHI